MDRKKNILFKKYLRFSVCYNGFYLISMFSSSRNHNLHRNQNDISSIKKKFLSKKWYFLYKIHVLSEQRKKVKYFLHEKKNVYSQCKWFMGSSVTNDNFVFQRRSLLLHNRIGFCSIASHLEIDEAETRYFYRSSVSIRGVELCVHYSHHLPSSIQMFWEEKEKRVRTFFYLGPKDWTMMTGAFCEKSSQAERKRFKKRTNWIENEQSTRGLVERPYDNVYIYNLCNCEFNENFFLYSHVCDRLRLNEKKI